MSDPSENTYFGDNLTWDQYDERMFRITRKWVDEERSLFSCKWFDYRQLHPAQATYLYAHDYINVFRRHYALNFDRSATEGPTPIRPWYMEDIFESGPPQTAELRRVRTRLENYRSKGEAAAVAHVTEKLCAAEKKIEKRRNFVLSGLWRGRMVADMMGMPYDIFIDFSFAHRLRGWRQAHMPGPHMLYEFKFGIEVINDKWSERQASSIVTATNDIYRNDNYQNTRAQNDHHEWLFDQAMKRENAAPILARFVKDNLLPREKIETRLGSDVLESVLSYT